MFRLLFNSFVLYLHIQAYLSHIYLTMNGSTNTPPPSSSTAASSDKLSGQLIIKAQLGDDIRKMMIHNEDLTLNGK